MVVVGAGRGGGARKKKGWGGGANSGILNRGATTGMTTHNTK